MRAGRPALRVSRVRLPELLVWALLLGGGYAAIVVGRRVLDPTDVGWLANDPAMAFNGWSFLRAEPRWHFPPTYVERLGWPVGISVSFLDVTPLVALPLRVVAPWLPRPFQYFGLMAVAHGTLQMLFGMLLARRWYPSQRWPVVLWGLAFLLAPAFAFRLHGHFSLAAHWLILAALVVYLRVEDDVPRRRLLTAAGVLLWMAGGVHPYLMTMAAAVLFAALVRMLLAGRVRAGAATMALVVCATAALASVVVHGFVVGGDRGAFVAAGFGTYSFNLLGLVDPQGAGSILLRSQPSLPGQGEGFSYLGLGVLVLVVMAAPTITGALGRMPLRRWLPLAVVCSAMALFAASNRITVGQAVLGEVRLPPWAVALGGTYRASGRFVWPAVYALMLASLWALSRRPRSRAMLTLLAVAVVLQLVDSAGVRRIVRTILVPAAPPALHDVAWRALASAHDHLVVLPAWQCGAGDSPAGTAGQGLFGRVALENGLTLNSFYAGRYEQASLTRWCTKQPHRFLAHGAAPRTAYVLGDAWARALATQASSGWGCARADGVVLCRSGVAEPGFAPALRRELFPALAPGASAAPSAMAAVGWKATPSGLALVGRRARLAFRHEGLPAPLVVRVAVASETATGRRLEVHAFVDGNPQAIRAQPLPPGASTVSIPLGLVAASTIVGLDVRVPGADGAAPGALRVTRVGLASPEDTASRSP